MASDQFVSIPVSEFESLQVRARIVTKSGLSKLWKLFDEYEAEVHKSALAEGSKADYIYFAQCFVRWLDGDYTPGQGVK